MAVEYADSNVVTRRRQRGNVWAILASSPRTQGTPTPRHPRTRIARRGVTCSLVRRSNFTEQIRFRPGSVSGPADRIFLVGRPVWGRRTYTLPCPTGRRTTWAFSRFISGDVLIGLVDPEPVNHLVAVVRLREPFDACSALPGARQWFAQCLRPFPNAKNGWVCDFLYHFLEITERDSAFMASIHLGLAQPRTTGRERSSWQSQDRVSRSAARFSISVFPRTESTSVSVCTQTRFRQPKNGNGSSIRPALAVSRNCFQPRPLLRAPLRHMLRT